MRLILALNHEKQQSAQKERALLMWRSVFFSQCSASKFSIEAMHEICLSIYFSIPFFLIVPFFVKVNNGPDVSIYDPGAAMLSMISPCSRSVALLAGFHLSSPISSFFSLSLCFPYTLAARSQFMT